MKSPFLSVGPTAAELLERLGDRDEDAAAHLYTSYAKRIRGLIRSQCSSQLAPRVDPDDVLQSVFRAFIESARRGAYNVPDSESLWNLLAMITVNKLRTARSFHHAARRDVRLTKPLPDAGLVDGLPSAGLIGVAVRDVLERLPAAARAVAELRLSGYEVAEIAERLNLSRRSVERLLQGCRQDLRVLLDLEK